MESTTSAILFYAAMLGGPLAASLIALLLRWRAWLVLLAAYLGEVVCTETFRIWHTQHFQTLVASGSVATLPAGRTPPLVLRLLLDVGTSLIFGGMVLGIGRWMRRRAGQRRPTSPESV